MDILLKARTFSDENAELNLLKSVFEASADGIAVARPLLSEDGSIFDFEFIMINSVSCRLHGMELTGRRLSEAFSCDEHPELLGKFLNVAATGSPLDVEMSCSQNSVLHWYRHTAALHRELLVITSSDITERKKTEMELRARNEELEVLNTIHETAEVISNSGTYTHDVETDKSWFTDNLYRIFGVNPGDFVPSFESVSSFLHPEDREKRLIEGRNFISSGSNYISDYRIVRPDGEVRHLRNVNCSHTLKQGKKILLGITQDITDHKHTLASIEETRVFASRIANSIPDILYVFDIKTYQFIYVNNNSSQLFDVTSDQLRHEGKSVIERVVHPADLEKQMQHLTDVQGLAEHEMIEVEVRLLCNQSEYRCFRLKDSVFRRNPEGEVTQIIGLATDITERKAVRDKLRKQESLMREAERLGNMGSWERTMATGDLIWSEGMYKIFGLEQSLIVPSLFDYVQELVHPDDRARVQRSIADLYGKFVTEEISYRILRKDGEERVVSSRPQIIYNEENKPAVIRGIIRDITQEMRAAEERLRLREQLQKELTNAVINAQEQERRNLGEALHNGVGQLLFALKMLLESPQFSEENLHKIQSILNEAQRQTKSISFGLVPPLIRDYGLKAAVQDMITKQVTQMGLNISATFKGRMTRFNGADEIGVFRIIQELINNTIKHANATKVCITISQKKTEISVVYIDNGEGFDAEKTLRSSAGFGLRSIRTRVDLLAGKLDIDSNKETGSKFTISLKCRESE